MRRLVLILVLGVLIAGCVGQQSPDSFAPPKGTLQLKFTDSVENITKLEIKFSEISLLKSGTADVNISEVDVNYTTEAEEYAADNSTKWVKLTLSTRVIDLVDVKSVTEVFNEIELESGKYMQIRMLVEKARLFVGGEEKNISIRRANVKFGHPFKIAKGRTTSLVFDFDADQSVVFENEEYILKPVVHMKTELSAEKPEVAKDLLNRQKVENIKERAKRGK